MDRGHRLRIIAASLALFAMGLLWAVGSGEAQPGDGPIYAQTTDADARGQGGELRFRGPAN